MTTSIITLLTGLYVFLPILTGFAHGLVWLAMSVVSAETCAVPLAAIQIQPKIETFSEQPTKSIVINNTAIILAKIKGMIVPSADEWSWPIYPKAGITDSLMTWI